MMLRLVGMGAAPAAIMGVSLGLLLQPNWTPKPMGEIPLSQAVENLGGPPPVVTRYPITEMSNPPPEPLLDVRLTASEVAQINESLAQFARAVAISKTPASPETVFVQTALESPVPAAEPRFVQEEPSAPLSPESLSR